MTTTLRVLGRYRSSLGSYESGQVIELSDEEARFLRNDSPGTFEVVEPAQSEYEAISATTNTDLHVPDRRMRGGRRRAE